MKLVRRTHLYTGLLLLPWVVFFGFSGMLFNHPGFGPEETIGAWTPDETRMAGFAIPDPDRLADELVAALNRPEFPLSRVSADDAAIEGAFVFQGETEGGTLTVALDPAEGDARAVKTSPAKSAAPPAFLAGKPTTPEGLDPDRLGSIAGGLLAATGTPLKGELSPTTRGGAELRFRVESPGTGQRWNLSWNLQSGALNARETGKGGPDLYTALTRFHKTHHYPEQMGARWLWSAFADATGLTMVFWGISGAIMWWQLKPTRLLGVAGLSVAGVLALFVFAGTFRNLHWVPRESRPPAAAGATGTKGGSDAAPRHPAGRTVPAPPVTTP